MPQAFLNCHGDRDWVLTICQETLKFSELLCIVGTIHNKTPYSEGVRPFGSACIMMAHTLMSPFIRGICYKRGSLGATKRNAVLLDSTLRWQSLFFTDHL